MLFPAQGVSIENPVDACKLPQKRMQRPPAASDAINKPSVLPISLQNYPNSASGLAPLFRVVMKGTIHKIHR
jgi:hypothetical protein